MESSDSDLDEDEVSCLLYWNNWSPSGGEDILNQGTYESRERNFVYNKKYEKSLYFDTLNDTPTFGNWIPPLNFGTISKKTAKYLSIENVKQNETLTQSECSKVVPKQSTKLVINENVKIDNLNSGHKNIESIVSVTEGGKNIWKAKINWRKKVNLDWGKRAELHDVSRFNDGQLFWGVINAGLFGHIKLWTNEYGYVCGSAEGTISKLGSTEMTLISITDSQLLRKMLRLSQAQWSAVCEMFKETKSVLKFDAFLDFDLSGKTPLEKLWFAVCKRRHLLPGFSVQVKLSGAIKCMRQFRIIPKLIVQDVRSIQGEPIL